MNDNEARKIVMEMLQDTIKFNLKQNEALAVCVQAIATFELLGGDNNDNSADILRPDFTKR